MVGESESKSPGINLRSPETKPNGLSILRLNIDPTLESDPELAWKIVMINTAAGVVNAFNIHMSSDKSQPLSIDRKTELSKKTQTYQALNYTFVASDLTKFTNREEDLGALFAMKHLQDVPGSIFGRETTENPSIPGKVKYPKGTIFNDITLDTPELIKAVADNADTLLHDLGNSFGGYRGRIQIAQSRALRNAKNRLSSSGKPVTQADIIESDIGDKELHAIELEYKIIEGFIKSEAPELLGDQYPKENLSGLTFQETIDKTLKRNLPPETVLDTVLILDPTSRAWLEDLRKRVQSHIVDIDLNSLKEIRMDDGDKLITSEIESLLSAYNQGQENGRSEDLALPISPILIEQMKFTFSAAKLRRLIGNGRQNAEKSFEGKRLKKAAASGAESETTQLEDTADAITPFIKILENGNTIVLGLADNGIGIPAGFKIEKGNSTWENLGVKRGSGIGLAAQSAEAEHPNYNGKIALENNALGGASLTLSLPLQPFY